MRTREAVYAMNFNILWNWGALETIFFHLDWQNLGAVWWEWWWKAWLSGVQEADQKIRNRCGTKQQLSDICTKSNVLCKCLNINAINF